MELYEKIFNLIESGKTLVLPTEMAARSILERYVRETKKSVSFSSAVAFDTFLEDLYKRDKSLKKADALIRLLFSKDLIEKYSDRLKYFIPNNSYEELKERMVFYIASSIPHFEDEGKINSAALGDVMFIKARYLEFLARALYYEPSYTKDLENKLEKDYVLLFAESSEKMISLYNNLKDKRHVEVFRLKESDLPSLIVYDNEKMEIRNTFLSIKEDIKRGLTLDKIAIVTASYERDREYLEREAYLFDVPLMFMRGKSALEYPAGYIYKGIKDLYDSDYDIESLEKFFLSSSIPFRDQEGARTFILRAIERGIKKKGKDDPYRYVDINSIYHDLKHYVTSINETSDPDYLINQIKSLFEKLLKDEQFSTNEEDERVSSYLMDSLESFSSRVRELRNLGLLSKNDKLFTMFINYMGNTIYVPRNREKGIRVYPLAEDNGIFIEKRYVLSLNERDSRLIKKNISYLSDYELEEERVEIDLTRTLLEAYKETSSEIVYSAAENTYDGFVLPLLEFEKQEKAVLLKDSIADEHIILKDKSLDYDLYPITKKSYRIGRDKSLKNRDRRDDVSYERSIDNAIDVNDWTFSVSQIDKYEKCPFIYYLDYVLHLKREREYMLSDYPALEVGNALHKVFELYYKNGRGDAEQMVDKYLTEVLDLWSDRKTLDRDLNEIPLDASSKPLTDELRVYIEANYKKGIVGIINELNRRSGTFTMEKEIKGKIKGYNFKGFIDCLIENEDSFDLIDFKTSKAPTDSRQFDIYRYIYMNESQIENSKAQYALIKTGKLKKEESSLDKDLFETIMDLTITSIKIGQFYGERNRKACKDCSYRGTCRRRFFVR